MYTKQALRELGVTPSTLSQSQKKELEEQGFFTVEEVLTQAMLAAPMFTARWRWNASRALAVLRFRGGRRTPPPIQRMQSDDLLAAVFPDQAACAENLVGEIRIPNHPLVKETIANCLHEAMDLNGLTAKIGRAHV